MSMKCVDCGSQRLESIPCDFGCPHYNCLDCRARHLARNDTISFCMLVNKDKKVRFSSRIYITGHTYGQRIEATHHNIFFTKEDTSTCALPRREPSLGEGLYSQLYHFTIYSNRKLTEDNIKEWLNRWYLEYKKDL